MPAIPRANRRMNDMLRKERAGLEEYNYGGAPSEVSPKVSPPPDAAIIAVAPDDEASEPLPDNEMAEGEAPAAAFTVLEPGEEDPPDMYVYAQGETPGTWTMYPPGVPCDSGTVRVALDHPATAADLARMDEEVGGGEAPIPTEAEVY